MKVVTIGRSKEHNDIVVNDEKVSRNHLQMIMDDNGNYSVQDLNSTNGTFVNGRRISGQVPLKVTDELRIGNTVLSWQCYFGSQPNTGTYNPVPLQSPISQMPPTSPQKPILDPPKPKWLIYAIIGAVILLLMGGGIIGWKIFHNNQQNILDKQLQEAQINAATAEAEYQTAQADYQKAEAEAAKAEAKAARSNSEQDREDANLAREKANQKQKELIKAQEEKAAADQRVNELGTQLNKVKAERDTLEAQIKETNNAKAKAERERIAAQQAQEYAEKETELITEFYELSMNLTENQVKQACADLKFDTKGKKAKDVISDKFKQSNNDKKAQINAALRKAKESTGENDKASIHSQPKTDSTPDSQTVPSDNSNTTPSSTSQPSTIEPQPNTNN